MGVSPSPNGMLSPWFFFRSLMCRVTMRSWCFLRKPTASWLAAVKWPMSRFVQMYSEVAIAFSRSSAVANSLGSIREWLCMPTRILCLVAAVAMRGTVFWLAEAVMTFAPIAFAISNPRSTSASVKSSWKL